MELTDTGRLLANALLQQSEGASPERRRPGRWLIEWLRGGHAKRPFGLANFAKQLGPCSPSAKEKQFVRTCVHADTSSPHFLDRERRRRLATVLEGHGSREIVHLGKQLFEPLRQTGSSGAKHVLDMKAALAFQKMREAALSVVKATVEEIADPDRGKRISEIQAGIKAEIESLGNASTLFLRAAAAAGSSHPDARYFAEAMCNASTALTALAQRDGRVLLESGSRILGGSVFRAFKQRRLIEVLPGEDDGSDEGATAGSALPFRIWNFHQLLMDCAP